MENNGTRKRAFTDEEERIIDSGIKELFNSPKVDNKELYESLSGKKKSEDIKVEGSATQALKAQRQNEEAMAKCGSVGCIIS
ncbi:MAG: hypothetical protein COV35_05400 [Alphaproteobacteria bacterium CG11_big_fil_rev_8_21_14_0_20_39_49]|nr:MAG: hypothetical protein COV35_05400 [Alphaproteobacteria bacterium CG11_big_fil_rev_8_21_14_0_20_39_49]